MHQRVPSTPTIAPARAPLAYVRPGVLPRRPAGVTAKLRLVGAAPGRPLSEPPGEHLYGSEAAVLGRLPGANHWLWRDGDGGLSEAMVRFAVRHEMARTIEDVLARRCRLLFLDAARAADLIEPVAALLSEELQREVPKAERSAFKRLALQYRTLPA